MPEALRRRVSRRAKRGNRASGRANRLGFSDQFSVRSNGRQESITKAFDPSNDCTDRGGRNRILELRLPGDSAGLLNVEAKLVNQIFRNRTFGGQGVLFARVFVKIDE